jgi:hypothetical protein
MRQPHGNGNGSGKVEIGFHDLGTYVRVISGPGAAQAEDLPGVLAQALTDFFAKNPEKHLRFIVPINRDGTTVELQAWYEEG